MDLPYVVTILAVALVALAIAVALGVALSRSRGMQRRLAEELVALRDEQTALQSRFFALADKAPAVAPAPGAPAAPAPSDYLITTLSEGPGRADAADPGDDCPATPRSFVGVAATESLVRAATLAQGVRRALSAESRNRIRFEVSREVKRSRKQRRRDLREARRAPARGPARTVEEDAA